MVLLAKDFKCVENTEVIPIGQGLWKIALAVPTVSKITVADPATHQVGIIGVIEVNGKPTIVDASIKIV